MGVVQHTARRIDYLVGAPRKYSPVPNTFDQYPPSDPSGAPGETGTGGCCGTTSELLGLRIGARTPCAIFGKCSRSSAAASTASLISGATARLWRSSSHACRDEIGKVPQDTAAPSQQHCERSGADLTITVRCRPRAAAGRHRSKLGWQIAVDLEADADLDESRGRPSHVISSSFLAT